MTDYCSQSDVQANMKGLELNAATKVTPTTLAGLITQESAVIDQHIRRKYELEITDTTSLTFLKKICIDLVVYRVTKILQPKVAVATPEGENMQDISHSSAYREAMRMLKDIQTGKSTLPGEAERDFSFFSSTAVDDDQEMEFDSGCKQW